MRKKVKDRLKELEDDETTLSKEDESEEADHEQTSKWYKKAFEGYMKVTEDEISSTENYENFEIETLSGDELKPLIIKTFQSFPKKSCVYGKLDTKVLKYLGSKLLGNKRKKIAKKIKRATVHLQTAGILEKYKNPGKASNKRIRLTNDYIDKLSSIKKTWTKQSGSPNKMDFEDTANVDKQNEPKEEDSEEVVGKKLDNKSIQIPDLSGSDDFDPFFDVDADEEFQHDEETKVKLDILTGNAGEPNDINHEGDTDIPLVENVEHPPKTILPYLVDSLSSMPDVLTGHKSGKVIVFLHQNEFHDIKIYLEIKGDYLVAESFFRPNPTMLEPLIEVSGSPDFSCKFGKENMRYVVRRNCEIKNRTADDIYQNILEVMSDVRRVNDLLTGEE